MWQDYADVNVIISDKETTLKFRQRTLNALADMICGNGDSEKVHFVYRSSSYLTEFFADCDTDYRHDGSTRRYWVSNVLAQILSEPHPSVTVPPETFIRVIRVLMDPADAINEGPDRALALAELNAEFAREGFEAFYGEDKLCHLRHIATNTIGSIAANPHRPFSASEIKRRDQLIGYLDNASEDDLIDQILVPLFRQLGFHRITPAGHKDKALEYGKDVWMKYTLPTQHVLYFGMQAKIDKIDSAGSTQKGNANVAEILNQVGMMLGHEIFDPEIGKKVLVDHAFIASGGEITKAARNWLGGRLDATKRSQILFMDRDDILNLFIVTNLPLPDAAVPQQKEVEDDFPF
jgi:hypothetical protein